MTVDAVGRLWAATDDAVIVFAPDGRRISAVPQPERGSNCCFSGDSGATLFITAGGSLYVIETSTRAHG